MAHFPSVNANKVASGRNPSKEAPISGRASSIWKRLRTLPPRLLALAIGMGILGWAYWPNLQNLFAVWTEEPNYSHGWLVIPIALSIFWQRLAETRTDWQASRVPWWSWMPLVAILAAPWCQQLPA